MVPGDPAVATYRPRTWLLTRLRHGAHYIAAAHIAQCRDHVNIAPYCTAQRRAPIRAKTYTEHFRGVSKVRASHSPYTDKESYKGVKQRNVRHRYKACDKANKACDKASNKACGKREANEQIGARTLALFAVWLLGGNARWKLRGYVVRPKVRAAGPREASAPTPAAHRRVAHADVAQLYACGFGS